MAYKAVGHRLVLVVYFAKEFILFLKKMSLSRLI